MHWAPETVTGKKRLVPGSDFFPVNFSIELFGAVFVSEPVTKNKPGLPAKVLKINQHNSNLMRLEWYKFEISLDQTKETKELELIFLLDNLLHQENHVMDRIQVKLDTIANGSTYKILSWVRQHHIID